MAIDSKYGRVTLEHSTIGDDEPVVVFRAKDVLLPGVLDFYLDSCSAHGSPVHHLGLIQQTRDNVEQWQREHGSKIPDSNWALKNGHI